MGRLTQSVAYINEENHPTKDDIKSKYTHLNIDDEVKKIRRDYRKELKK